jgi:hypothetical protein
MGEMGEMGEMGKMRPARAQHGRVEYSSDGGENTVPPPLGVNAMHPCGGDITTR